MPLFHCDVHGCTNAAQRGAGYCLFCNCHFCDVHVDDDLCVRGLAIKDIAALYPQVRRDVLSRLAARLDVTALRKKATDLRGGIPCTVSALERGKLMVGTVNWHVPVTFADGVVWLCRIPVANARTPPQAAQDQSLLAEFGTYRFLASIGIPVPAVFNVSIPTPSNPGVGVSCLFMEKIAGKPLDWYTASPEGKVRVLEQLADIYAKIKSHPLPSIGSFYASSDLTTISIGPIADPVLSDVSEDGTLSSFGPFISVVDYAKSILQQRLDHIVARESWFKFATDGYLLHRFLLDNVDSLPIVKGVKDGEFYFLHGESKGDHIFVDEDYKITGIIDCEGSQTATAPLAFAAPLFLVDWDMYVNGVGEITPGDKQFVDILKAKGYSDLARYARGTRFARDWAWVVLTDELAGDTFYKKALGMLKFCGEECGETLDEASWAEWTGKMLKKYADDAGLQSLISSP
ncbi:hypothetical protein OF83DRAFT_1054044 [Amylostereum chailletii]|nr:hypothetical protein OF83DRAFT_1054044 [Amylostereum chailletii]